MKRIILPAALLMLSGCASVPYERTASGILDTYLNHHYSDAILQFGPPNEIYSDGAGGRILHWGTTTPITTGGYSYTTGSGRITAEWDELLWRQRSHTFTRPPQTIYHTNYVQLYVNPGGDVYYWRHNVRSADEIRASRRKSSVGWAIGSAAFLGAFAILLAAE